MDPAPLPSTVPTQSSGSPQPIRSRRRRLLALWVLIIGAIIADGSRHVPADPTKPIEVRGETTYVETHPRRLRIATFNIHSGKGRDRRVDLNRTAAVLESPLDLVGLNEVRGTIYQPWWPDQAYDLGTRLGMKSAFVPTERQWWHDHFGNAILSRIPLQHIYSIPLVGTRGKAFRCASLAQFEFDKRTVQWLNVHIDSQSDRESQLQAIVSLFRGLKSPALLTGDLNSGQDDPALKGLLADSDVKDALSAVKQEHRIDWILMRGFRCRSSHLIENEASDHPAVTAELELED